MKRTVGRRWNQIPDQIRTQLSALDIKPEDIRHTRITDDTQFDVRLIDERRFRFSWAGGSAENGGHWARTPIELRK